MRFYCILMLDISIKCVFNAIMLHFYTIIITPTRALAWCATLPCRR